MRLLKPSERVFKHLHSRRQLNPAGNVLIYVVVLMLIFGVLGVVMVSLFTSTTASTVTRNDSRRARYMAESGMRYAFSEMRKADFDLNHMINTLNTTTYQIGGTESFDINVFTPWFEADGDTNNSGVGTLPLLVPIGAVPVGYTIPVPPDSIYAINYEFTGLNPTDGGRAVISGYSIPARPPPPDTLTLDLSDDFYANSNERVAFGVQPATGQDINAPGVNLDLPLEAQYFLPKYGGAISIRRNDYFYEERKEEPDGAPTKVVLTNLSKASKSEWLTSQTDADDWVVMSPRNYLVVPKGTSDGTIYDGDYLFGKGIYDGSLIRPDSAPPDITAEDLLTYLSEQETDTQFYDKDMVDYELDIGGGRTNEFGSAFFEGDMSIGGDQEYCSEGACLFAIGVRVYFLLDFNQQGDGITFTLLSGPPNNTADSAGGDVDLSELMGYAGDSRTNSAGTTFLATAAADRGLDPPKIAVEFDTRTNNDTLAYCNGASENQNTRDDPLLNNQDAVQYVFWGREVLDLLCRSGSDNSTYDDNRHGPGFWEFDNPTEDVKSSPAVDPGDGTIYVGSNDNKLYAINPDGSQKWAFTTGGDVISSPAVGSDGTIYVGSNDNKVYAIRPNDGTQKWQFGTGGDVRSSPAIASDGTIYIGSDDGMMHALDPTTGFEKPGWPFNAGAVYSLGRPAIGPDGTIHFSALNALLYARNPDGSEKWTTALGPIGPAGSNNTYMPGVDPNTGRIYTDVSGNALAALNPSNGNEIWRVDVRSDIDSTPVVGPDGTIYFGTDSNAFALFAVTPAGTVKWEFTTGDEVDNTPALSPDGSVVYVVSNDGNVYAVDTDTGEEKWSFVIITNTGDSPTNVTSSPAVDPSTGMIYVGSDDSNVYALTPFDEEPRNEQGLLLTSADLGAVSVDSADNWLNGASTKGPWAVRLEVDRSTLPGGEGDYELRLWMKQCINDTCDNINTADNPFPIDDPFFKDTRIKYELSPPDLVQSFQMDAIENAEFDRFLFGFTAAAGAQALAVNMANFTLSFSRPSDSVIDLPEF